MHISLDSALGRQRRLNSVGESVFQIAPNPSAGYSLRSLTGGDPAVVRVRRASDNSEKDFNSSGVSSGELVNWVNAQVVPPLDVRELVDGERTGALIPAAAAYSLRNLSASYTGNVVDVRRSSDDTEDSFTAAEVADGTLTDFVNVGKDYVGYARFQDSETSNVNLSSSLTLEASESWSIKFGYIGGTASNTGLFGGTASNTGFWFANQSTIGLTDDSDSYQPLSFGNALALKLGQHHEIEFFNTPSEGVRVTVDGVTMSTTPKIYGDITLNKIGVSRGRTGDRVIENVRIDLNGDGTLDYSYAGDGNQASNWTDRVGSNNGIPTAQVLTYNNEYTDGFVTQWYDQSGNANHATQGTDASQPKIVDAGVLVRDSKNNPAIDFDGIDDNMDLTSSLATVGAYSCIAYHEFIDTTMILKGDLNVPRIRRTSSTTYQIGSHSPQVNQNFTVASTLGLVSVLKDASHNARVYDNGTESSSGQQNVGSGPLPFTTLGTNVNDGAGDGKIVELIYYPSDQSDNRTAFEANIGETYGIDLPSGVDTGYDQVDGFVETWYDQSGNGNDATQSVASNQPKIVDAGVLVTGGLEFNGSSTNFRMNSEVTLGTEFYVAGVMKLIAASSETNATILGAQNMGGDRLYLSTSNNRLAYRNNSTNFSTPLDPSGTELELVSYTSTLSNITVSLNGTDSVNVALTASMGAEYIGGGGYISGSMTELIIYNSDQSANRVAIETNINNQYDIY